MKKGIFFILFLILTVSVPSDAELIRSHMVIRLLWIKPYPSAFQDNNGTNLVAVIKIKNLTAYGITWSNDFPDLQLNITLNEKTNSGNMLLLAAVYYNETINYLGNISIILIDGQNNSNVVSGQISIPNPTDNVLVQGNDCQSFRQDKEKMCTQTYKFEYFEARIRSELIAADSSTTSQTSIPISSVLLGIIVLAKIGYSKRRNHLQLFFS